MVEMNAITIPAAETPAHLRGANTAGAIALEYIRDRAAILGDTVTHQRAGELADALARATAEAAAFIEANCPPEDEHA